MSPSSILARGSVVGPPISLDDERESRSRRSWRVGSHAAIFMVSRVRLTKLVDLVVDCR